MSRELSGRRLQRFRQPIAKPKGLPPEANVWYWNPNRIGIRLAPAWFRKRLHEEFDPDLEVTWAVIHQRWLLWVRHPKINQSVCQGWRLLFVHQSADHQYLPLDERVFARLVNASVDRHGSAKRYVERIVSEFERDRELTEKRQAQEAIDFAMPYWEHSQISVSGYGKSNGSKFSTYHS